MERLTKWINSSTGALYLICALLTAFSILTGCTDARAQTVTDTVSWTMPTQRVGGAALPINEIAKTTIAWGTVPGGPYPNIQDVISPAVQFVFTRGTPATGTRCYTAFVTDTQGRVGGSSAEGCKTIVAVPNPPTSLQVN
jgi:hypothetical protein